MVLAPALGKAFSCLWTHTVPIYLIHIQTLKNLAYCSCQSRSCSTGAADAWGGGVLPPKQQPPPQSAPLQSSSEPSSPGLFLTASSKPCGFPVQKQADEGWQKWKFAFVSEECWAGSGGYLSLVLQLALLSLSVTSRTAKPQNGLQPRVLTLVVTIPLSGSHTTLTDTPFPVTYLGKGHYRRWYRHTQSEEGINCICSCTSVACLYTGSTASKPGTVPLQLS